MVMSLALIALSAALLVRLANHGLALTLEARTRYERLQAKWSAASCRHAFLAEADRLFGDSDAAMASEGAGWPFPSELSGWFQVGEVRYQLLVADEQAKLNLNAAYERQPAGLGALLTDAERSLETRVPLRRDVLFPQSDGDGSGPVFQSWGEIMDLAGLVKADGGARGLVEFARRFTYSENQRLNVRRAPEEALRQTARLLLTHAETEELVESRRGYAGEFRDWLASVDIPSRRLVGLRRLLTDRSGGYSLWLWSEEGASLALATVGLRRGDAKEPVLQWP